MRCPELINSSLPLRERMSPFAPSLLVSHRCFGRQRRRVKRCSQVKSEQWAMFDSLERWHHGSILQSLTCQEAKGEILCPVASHTMPFCFEQIDWGLLSTYCWIH